MTGMLRLRSLSVLGPLASMALVYACSSDDTPGAPVPIPDAGRDVGYRVYDSEAPTIEDGAAPADGSLSSDSMIAMGDAFGCVLSKDRTVFCWGKNDVGQLGREPNTTPSCGTFPCSPMPLLVEGLKDIVDIVAGSDFACALDASGTVFCWGGNSKGQLGTQSPAAYDPKPTKNIVRVTKIAAGGAHACAITTDSLPYCWGENTCNVFGDVGASQRYPKQIPTVPILAQIAVGPDAICGTMIDGRALCWGADHRGSLGHTLAGNAPLCNGVPSDPVPKFVQQKGTELPIASVSQVAVGLGVACARYQSGKIACWGDNERGSLGLGVADSLPHARAEDVPALSARALDLHGQTPCVIAADRLLCWGDAQDMQFDPLDAGCPGCRPLPIVIPGQSAVRDVSAGPSSIATIKSDLTVWLWGRNSSAELALPLADPKNTACVHGLCVSAPQQATNMPSLQ